MPHIRTMQDLIDACQRYNDLCEGNFPSPRNYMNEPSDRFNTLFSALLLGEDKKLLKKRLMESVQIFYPKTAKDWDYDYENQRLISKTIRTEDGRTMTLQWHPSTTTRGGVGKRWAWL